MGYRVTKLIISILLAGSGAWLLLSQQADNIFGPKTMPAVLAGAILLLSGAGTLVLKLSSFNLFRLAVGGVIAAIVVRLAGEIIPEMMNDEAREKLVANVVFLVSALLLVVAYWFCLFAGSNIRRVLENIFSIPELLGKLVFTIALLAIYRVGFHVPLPGVDSSALAELASKQSGGLFGQAMEYFSMFTGGSLRQSTLFGLGIMPYISASIIFTLLVNVIPSLEKLQKEGPAGQKKIQEYTRYATVGLCLVQSIFIMKWLMSVTNPMLIYPEYQGSFLIFLVGVCGLTAGTIFLMWLGEQIDEYGIGNGISLLIMAGIIVRLPVAIRQLVQDALAGIMGPEKILFLAVSFVFVVAGSILITQGQRRIPIQQAKQLRGRRMYGGQRHFLPLRVNHGGVMPIIFASSLMIFPNLLFGWMGNKWTPENAGAWGQFVQMAKNALNGGTFTHTLLYIVLIYFFAFFWTTVNFRPKDMADQLRDMGHFIPGLRPGRRTAEYLERVMERITYCGAAFLAVIAVIPSVAAANMGIPFQISAFLGGTGLLIMVSVTLDLVQRIEANLVMRNYGGFLGGSTRIKGSR